MHAKIISITSKIKRCDTMLISILVCIFSPSVKYHYNVNQDRFKQKQKKIQQYPSTTFAMSTLCF